MSINAASLFGLSINVMSCPLKRYDPSIICSCHYYYYYYITVKFVMTLSGENAFVSDTERGVCGNQCAIYHS
jgi:hypothetical protein